MVAIRGSRLWLRLPTGNVNVGHKRLITELGTVVFHFALATAVRFRPDDIACGSNVQEPLLDL